MNIQKKIHNIGFIATRLQGTDGVSLETAKWSAVLERMGYTCYFFAGLSDWDEHRTMVVPEAFFEHPRIKEIQMQCFGKLTRSSQLTGEIHHMRVQLKDALYEFLRQREIDMIIPENALTIPMNIPLDWRSQRLLRKPAFPRLPTTMIFTGNVSVLCSTVSAISCPLPFPHHCRLFSML
jgi:hypothetical protein